MPEVRALGRRRPVKLEGRVAVVTDAGAGLGRAEGQGAATATHAFGGGTPAPGDDPLPMLRSRRNVDQPDHVLVERVVSHQAQRRPRSREVGLAPAEHHRMQVDPVLIDQA